MSQQITFQPSGRTCLIEAHETVLEASLRAGLTPAYGCSNGNCGSCKARLRSGDISQTRHHDYALSAAEKMDGAFLMCANRALSDIEVAAEVTQGPEDVPQQTIETKVKAIEPLDPQVIRLHLQTPRSLRLRFIAGQAVTLSFGDTPDLSFAIASCPCDDRNLYFHIPDVPDDPFSEAVFSGRLALRDTVRLRGPLQDAFFLDDKQPRPSVILCWHTGFAPVVSLIEHFMSLETEEDIHLYRFSPTPGHHYLANLCRSWSDAYDNIQIAFSPDRLTLLSSPKDCAAAIATAVSQNPNLAECNIYVAGPPNFVKAAQAVFAQRGPNAGHFKSRIDWLGAV